MKKGTALLILGLIAIYYFFLRGKVNLFGGTNSAVAGINDAVSESDVAASGGALGPVLTAGVSSPEVDDTASSVDPAINSSIVNGWAQTSLTPGDYAQYMRMSPSFTSAEWDSLYSLINGNQWGQPAAVTFWNAWRSKYHIDDGTYGNSGTGTIAQSKSGITVM